MAKRNRKFVQPGSLTQEKTKYEKLRQKNIERNAAIFEFLGLKSLRNGLFGTNSSAKKKSSKPVKSKMGSGKDDEVYQPSEDEEGMSSSSEEGVSSRLQGHKVCRAPKRKRGGTTTHVSRDSEPHWTALQKKVDDTTKSLTVVKGLVQVLAMKAGVDPAEIQEVIDRCNGDASTSGEEADVVGTSDESNTLDVEDGETSISDEDDATSAG